MARPRSQLRKILIQILVTVNPDYEKHLYFRQPSKGMKYPCILYKRNGESNRFADNIKYINCNRYSLTIIDENEDSEIEKLVKELPYCEYDREYEVEGLNHFVYTLYF